MLNVIKLRKLVIASQCAHWRGNPFSCTYGATKDADCHTSDIGHSLRNDTNLVALRGLLSPCKLYLTQMCQRTIHTPGIPCGAGISAEQHDPVAECTAFLRGQNGTQLFFHFFGVFALG